jgi:hypothetical protein
MLPVFSWLRKKIVGECFSRCTEPLSLKNSGEFLAQLTEYQFF